MSSPLSSNSHNYPSEGLSGSATGEVITVVVVVLFIFFVITLILYIRAKHYAGITGRPHPRIHFPPDPTGCRRSRGPLDPSVVASLPVAVCGAEGGAEDCAVCLSEFAEGEKARFLPECGHGFHVECIDTWFRSNSTCPLCRVQVGDGDRSVDETSVDVEEIRGVGVSSDEGSSSGASSAKVVMLPNPTFALERLRSRECDIEQGVQVEQSSAVHDF